MDKLVIEGARRLVGEVPISGSKNACLPVVAATLLGSGEHVVRNVPRLSDISTLVQLLENLGAKAERNGTDLQLDTRSISSVEATYDVVRKMRASVLVLGPLLARFGRARVSLPGGCAIGARPIDLHLRGLEALGAKIVLEHGYVEATAPSGGLVGAKIVLDMPSVTATENLMMAASLAKGTTVIENAAKEPEIEELAHALNQMGAKVSGAGGHLIQIEGVKALGGLVHDVGPDRIEAGTFMAAAAITGGNVVLRGVNLGHLENVSQLFIKTGCAFEILEERSSSHLGIADLRVLGPRRLQATDVRTGPFPTFPTDMQAQFMACMCVAEGTSQIEETVFENRFMHTLELMRMGADISTHGNLAVVKGQVALSGAPVMATDLRASASLVLAALVAEGRSEILRIYHLDRGYVSMEKKLSELGATIYRQRQEGEVRA